MEHSFVRAAEAFVVALALSAITLGVGWTQNQPPSQAEVTPLPAPTLQPSDTASNAAALPALETRSEAPLLTPPSASLTPDPTIAPSPVLQVEESAIGAGDAPLLQQEPGTINFLLLGIDAAANARLARTDTIIIASIYPNRPAVSLLSLPRDLQVRFPDGRADRINTVFEMGNIEGYPGGGAAYLSLVLRKNFGIRIDHYVRVNFSGFVKAIDTLGGVEVLVECELHDTFPDKDSPTGKSDLDLYPGKVKLSGKQALWYARSRWSTTDFDRARRQQKVIRAALRKVREGNWLQNALSLYADLREHIETSLSPHDLLPLIDIARRLDDAEVKSRVLTWPIVRSYRRADGASVLLPTEKTLSFIAEALAPPASNQAQMRPPVEVYNATGRADMELVAAERLIWEGFNVISLGTLDERFPRTQIINYLTTSKGSPIPRLKTIFNVEDHDVIGQADPSSPAVARVVLGENYDSCPNTAFAAGEVALPEAGR